MLLKIIGGDCWSGTAWPPPHQRTIESVPPPYLGKAPLVLGSSVQVPCPARYSSDCDAGDAMASLSKAARKGWEYVTCITGTHGFQYATG